MWFDKTEKEALSGAKGKQKPKREGDFDFKASDNGITVHKWKDNNVMNVVSNYGGSEVSKVTPTQKNGTKLEVTCHVSAADYNKNMGGVD